MIIKKITGELRRWSLKENPLSITGYIYGDKLEVFVDGTLRANLIVMSMTDEGDYYLVRTPAYLYKAYKAEQYGKRDTD